MVPADKGGCKARAALKAEGATQATEEAPEVDRAPGSIHVAVARKTPVASCALENQQTSSRGSGVPLPLLDSPSPGRRLRRGRPSN